jgi:hypothetical protein
MKLVLQLFRGELQECYFNLINIYMPESYVKVNSFTEYRSDNRKYINDGLIIFIL